MCPSASCCLDGVVRERIIFVRDGLFISSSPCWVSVSLLAVRELPSGSCEVGKDTGENSPVDVGVPAANAILCEDPHAIFVM